MELNICDLINFIDEKCRPETFHTEKLKNELTYLLRLVDRSSFLVDEDNDLNALLNRIKILITKAGQDLDLPGDIGSSKLDDAICAVLEEIWLLKPDMVLFLRLFANHPKLVKFLADVLAGYIGTLVDNLDLLLNYKAGLVEPFREELKVFQGNLNFLTKFFWFILTNNYIKESNDFNNFWNYVTAAAKKAADCTSSLLCWAYKSDEDKADYIGIMPVDLLQSTKPAKSDITCLYVGGLKLLRWPEFSDQVDVFAADFVNFMLEAPMTNLNSGSNLLVYKDRVQNLQILLRLLLVYCLCHNIHFNNESLVIFDLVVNEFWSFIDSLDNREMNEDLGKEFDLSISQLVQKMKPLASKILMMALEMQKETPLLVCQIDSIGYIDLVSQNLQRLLDHRIDLIYLVTHEIEVVLDEIKIYKPFLEGCVDQQGELCKEMPEVCTHMTGLFAKFEYLVDKFLVDTSPVTFRDDLSDTPEIVVTFSDYLSDSWEIGELQVALGDVIQKIKLFKEVVEFVYICKEKKDVRSDCQISKPSTPIIDEAVVGLEDQIDELMRRLTGGEANRKIIPIIGMPGIGKTTLAKRIYNDRTTSDHFDIQAWCSVSPRRTVSELLQDIIISIVDLNDDIYKSKELDSRDLVRRQLYRGRYLIVLDELWNSQILDELQQCFPDTQNGSRILVTAVQKWSNFDEPPLSVRLLKREESWELLQVKYNHLRFCNQGKCLKPPIPAEVGMRIAEKCDGLPLAIVLVAGFLVNTEDDTKGTLTPIEHFPYGKAFIIKGEILTEEWETLTEEAFAAIDVGPIIELSYKCMPGYLRQCFLYFAAFPQSTEIPISKLTWLWVSEGFVKKDEVKKPEEVAEDYLNDLMGRSLVMEAKGSSNGKLKSCRVHDCLYHFCRSRSRDENFLPAAWRYRGFSEDKHVANHCTVIYSSEHDHEHDWYRSWPSPLPERRLFRLIGQLVRVLDLG